RSTTALGAPFEEALRALGLPYEVRGWGATARNEVVRFLVGYLESLRDPDDEDAFESALASSLGGVGPHTVSRLRAHATQRGRPLTKVVRRLMYVLASRNPLLYPLPWRGEVAGDEPSTPDYMPFLTEEELQKLHGAMVIRQRLLRRAARLPLAGLAYSVLLEDGAMARLLDLDLAAGERAEALADLRAAIEGLESIELVHERLHGAKPLLADITGSLESLLAAAADDTDAAAGHRDAVQVMTVHQAKGLEFEVVFCAGFAHGLFPLAARPHPLLDPEAEARELTRASSRLEPGDVLLEREAEVLLAAHPRALNAPELARAGALGLDVAFLTDPVSGEPFEPYGEGKNPESVEIDHFS